MNEYRVKVTVRNNLLLSAIEVAGYKSQTEFAKAAGVPKQIVNDLVGLRSAPINYHHGTFTDVANAIMECLGACPTDLWTDQQLTMSLKKNTGEREVSEHDIQGILENHIEMMTLPSPEDDLMIKEQQGIVQAALDRLTPREADVLRMRMGDELTMREVGKRLNITGNRVMQIEAKALRKLRNPKTSKIRDAFPAWRDYK